MNFLTDDVKKLYGKFLTTSILSALVLSIYSFVDTIAVGQSEGAMGAAAMAVITPLYGAFVFLAILVGSGGAVLMSSARGEGKAEKGNAYFSAAFLLVAVMTVVAWLAFLLFHREIFTFFGADEELMPKVMEYAQWLIRFLPFFIAEPFLGTFVRTDGNPTLVMISVIIGGGTNMFFDWYLVFPLGMGMEGAAIATVIGTVLQVGIVATHLFRKDCGLRLVKPYKMSSAFRNIFSIGFGASALDFGTVVLPIMMNNQIMRYSGTTELAVYGVIVTVTALFQAMFCGVGQAIQPLVSANYGAKNTARIRSFWRLAFGSVIILGVIFTVIGELFPVPMVRLFIDATPDVIEAAPGIMRLFFVLFIPLGITVLSTYYLQSIMRGKMSTVISILRSAVVSGLLIYLLPLFLGAVGVWIAIPVSEVIVAGIALWYINRQDMEKVEG